MREFALALSPEGGCSDNIPSGLGDGFVISPPPPAPHSLNHDCNTGGGGGGRVFALPPSRVLACGERSERRRCNTNSTKNKNDLFTRQSNQVRPSGEASSRLAMPHLALIAVHDVKYVVHYQTHGHDQLCECTEQKKKKVQRV